MVKMSELKTALESLGLVNVVTYINSGNVAFDHEKTTDRKLVAKIEPAVETLVGKPIRVMVRSQTDIKRILDADPFAGKYESHKQMHVLFMDSDMPVEAISALKEKESDSEKFLAKGNEIYALLTGGVADSILGSGFIERKLGVAYTGRNWRTVQKLAEL